MDIHDLLRRFVEAAERLGIPYLITGSVAMIVHAEPRFTNDIDIVTALTLGKVGPFCANFPEPEFYCPEAAARDAARRHFQFNILHIDSGLKIDVIVPAADEYDRTRLARAVRLPTGGGFDAWFASAEDVILKKLVFFKIGESPKHLSDCASISRVQGERLDRAYIASWVERLGVAEVWRRVLEAKPEE